MVEPRKEPGEIDLDVYYGRKHLPEPPAPPPDRIISEDPPWVAKRKCEHTMMPRRWFGLLSPRGCVNSECKNYGGKRIPWTPPPPMVFPTEAERWVTNGKPFATPEQFDKMQTEELYLIRKALEEMNERSKPSLANTGPR